MGNCCTNEATDPSIHKEINTTRKKIKLIGAPEETYQRKFSNKKKFVKSKTVLAQPRFRKIRRKRSSQVNRSIDLSDKELGESERSSIKNSSFNPFLINSFNSGNFSINNFSPQKRFQNEDGEEFDSMISKSQIQQVSHNFGNSVLTNFSSNSPLLHIQKEIPYFLLIQRDHKILKEHPNYSKFKHFIDKKNNIEYFGELNNLEEENGFGVKTLHNGDLYIGNFEEGVIRGKGVMYFGMGDAVKGFFGKYGKNGIEGLIGKGLYRWKSGKKYHGFLEAGIPNGKGISFLTF